MKTPTQLKTWSSLAQAAYALLKANKLDSEEFQSLIKIFGLEKIDQLITEEYLKEQKACQKKP